MSNKEVRKSKMSAWSKALFETLPEFTRKQLLFDQDHRGNVEITNVETEKLLAYLVGEELKRRKAQGTYKGSFAPVTHYFGYQGRSGLPSLFDSKLASTYGFVAGVLVSAGATGYCVTARGVIDK